jgi:phenylacetate-CoA ligase
MHKLIAKYLVYYPVQILRGQYVGKCLSQVTPIQYKSTEEILSARDSKIGSLLRHASLNVPYYKKRFTELGIDPRDIFSFDDLAKLPVLTKRDILANEHDMVVPGYKGRLFMRKTSGSTGMTLHFKKNAKSLALNDAIMYRCYAWYGIDIGDKQARFWGVPVVSDLRRKEQIKDMVLNRIRISAFDISEPTCRQEYGRLLTFKPAYFYGYTTAIYGFALISKMFGLDLKKLSLKAVVCTAEKMYPHHRTLLEEAFSCPIVDEYGSSENGIISFECRKKNMHMMSDHLAIEFINENGQPAKSGELGRIVVTDLSSFAMPLIRYEIGDMGRYSEKTCNCGINLPLMEIVEGRKEDFIRTESGKLVHAAYLCYTLKDDSVSEFKMYQKTMDSFLVQIVKSPLFNEESEKKLENNIRTALGEKVKIKFEYLERIPRESSGKLRYFVSEIKG